MEQIGMMVCGNCNPCENNNKFLVVDHAKYGDRPPNVDVNDAYLSLEEDATFFCRCCCANLRSFEMLGTTRGQRVFKLQRDHKILNCRAVENVALCCLCGGCCFCPEIVHVYGQTDGQKLGRIEQRHVTPCYNDGFKCCNCAQILEVYDGNDNHVSDLDINYCTKKNICSCGAPVFDILTYPYSEPPVVETRVQNIFMGLGRECCQDVENFKIDFDPAMLPNDQGIRAKSPAPVPQETRTLHIAASILLKYVFFEKEKDQEG